MFSYLTFLFVFAVPCVAARTAPQESQVQLQDQLSAIRRSGHVDVSSPPRRGRLRASRFARLRELSFVWRPRTLHSPAVQGRGTGTRQRAKPKAPGLTHIYITHSHDRDPSSPSLVSTLSRLKHALLSGCRLHVTVFLTQGRPSARPHVMRTQLPLGSRRATKV